MVEAKAQKLQRGDPVPPDLNTLVRVFDAVSKAMNKYCEMEESAADRDGVVGITPEEVLKFDTIVAYAETAFTNALWNAEEQVSAVCWFELLTCALRDVSARPIRQIGIIGARVRSRSRLRWRATVA